MTRFYLNHIGYSKNADPTALVDVTEAPVPSVEVLSAAGWTLARTLPLAPPEPGFLGRHLARVDLSSVPPGRYVLAIGDDRSSPFWIGDDLLHRTTLDALLGYFKSQRCEGPWDEADRSVPFVGGREGSVDVHGGYYDASGDVSKYLSHLSYANYFNPQQTPLVTWALLEYAERLRDHDPGIAERLRAEVAHGADFLCRMQDPAGYFYMTVFDQWSKFPERRVICAYRTQKGELLPSYEAGYRQGGGLAIAALARAALFLGEPRYLRAAERGFRHLETENLRYLDDGRENIIDDYCALLAAVELHRASPNAADVRGAASIRMRSLVARLRSDEAGDGWWSADGANRPFFHASDAGLPALALLRYAEVFGEDEVLAPVERALRFELTLTNARPNPFGLARQYTVDRSGRRGVRFFIPHDNETGYWWQGENARLASLAAAAARLAKVTKDERFRDGLRHYAGAQLHWICGRNPYDSCMLHGFGHGNRNYMTLWPNAIGGICNGITSRFEDEEEVDFGRSDIEGDHSWRWFEQWLPHVSWFLLALAELDDRAI